MNYVVLFGKKDKSKGLQFYLLKIEKEKCTSVTNFNSMCNHVEPLRLTPLEISGQEHLAATCPSCNQIALYCLATKKWSVAFKDDKVPLVMCAGADNKLYVHISFNDQVVELDCSKPKFSGLIRKFTTWCSDMCYLPFPYNFLAVGDNCSRSIKAFSLDTNQVVWEVYWHFDGKAPYPNGLLYSARHDALLVVDNYKRVLVLDPRNGAHVQTISHPHLQCVMGFWFYDNAQTIVFHCSPNMISWFSINS